jgi:V/A-type H+/Na+-transporting ATPase subunit I
MPLPEAVLPVRMRRIAVVAPHDRMRDVLVALADEGTTELSGDLPAPVGPTVDALRRLERVAAARRGEPRISRAIPDLGALEQAGDWPTLAGEAELSRRADAAVHHGPVVAVVGWTSVAGVESLRDRLAPLGGALVELESPRWVDPPTLLRPLRVGSAFRPLVDTYGPARYADIDPTPFTAITFVLMFGMMFGDVGHGLMLVLLALILRRSRRPALARFRALWLLPASAGAAAAAFGLLYGEAFGPTGLVPTVWMAPLDDPVRLLVVAIGIGAILLAVSYAIGTLNRLREEGPLVAILAPSGVAGFLLLLAGGLALLGWDRDVPAVMDAALVLGLLAVALLAVGFMRLAGRGGVAVAETIVEVFDAVLRTAGNTVSFARLAAFGLVHAAISQAVVDGARTVSGSPIGWAVAALLFAIGTAVAFSLEALVAGVQGLRLEYYELFSRVFAGEGRPFRPWRLPVYDNQPASPR